MLYEENPKYLGEVMAALVGEDIAPHVPFHQQERRSESVPRWSDQPTCVDGIYLNKKLGLVLRRATRKLTWRHSLTSPGESRFFVALGNFDTDIARRFDRGRSVCEQQYREANSNITALSLASLVAPGTLRGCRMGVAAVSDQINASRVKFRRRGIHPNWSGV
jgi:hypothetical protein